MRMQVALWLLLTTGLALTTIANSKVIGKNDKSESINGIQSRQEVDEGSCICGLNKDILVRIESIVALAGREQTCTIPPANQQRDEDGNQGQQPQVVSAGQIGNSTTGDLSTSQVLNQEQSTTNGGFGDSTGGSVLISGILEGGNGRPNSSNGINDGTSSSDIQGSSSSSNGQGNGETKPAGQSNDLIDALTNQIQALQAQLANASKPPSSSQSGSASSQTSWRPNSQQTQQPGSSSSQITQIQIPSISTSGAGSWQLPSGGTSETSMNFGVSGSGAGSGTNSEIQLSTLRPESSIAGNFAGSISSSGGFLQGLPQTSITLGTGQAVQPSSGLLDQQGTQNGGVGGLQTTQEVQSAMESTVPNVVSNIFSNIQNLAIQTEHNPNSGSSSHTSTSSTLTSIDGSSVHLNKNDTAEQITAQGEELFLQWIEHQIQTFHMTASMASYIRKSALGLFRRIVKQYVERIERVGGRVEDNVRKATQIALNNTQNLIAFLLRNYLNVAGGLMQIIGEQVSRVGKQLDSTGETIAHINLNPFDIVSNVIDSLPNPSHYSEYFRAFGKYLMGESQTTQRPSGQEQQQGQQMQQMQQEQQQQQLQQEERHKGLFSKTMGALGKTLGSWLG